ncbi:MAG TPA: hypothetical protein VLX92_07205 [Kofleriaceae bacterium]|nr:hypothetical protein [Kofleriaceae bacterium]
MRIAIACAALAACTSSTDPYRLDHAQILAVRSEPAHVAAGGSVRIDALIGDDSGAVSVVVPDSVEVDGYAVTRAGDGWYVQSSPSLPVAPTATAAVTIDGAIWLATKQLDFADDRPNPTIAAMQVDGAAAETIAAAPHAPATLAAEVAVDGTASYAWYASFGSLERYRSSEATFESDRSDTGTVALVVRDDQGGVAWLTLPAAVP